MKQLLALVDDELYARLKARATAEGHSLNDLVSAVLAAAVEQPVTRQAVGARASAQPVIPDRTQRIPTHEEALATTRGLGRVASAALAAERAAR